MKKFKEKFKVGDWIIGKIDNKYGFTNSNTILEVKNIGGEDDKRYLGEDSHYIKAEVVVSFYEGLEKGNKFVALIDSEFRKVTPKDIVRFNEARKEFGVL